jgi:anthranilate phosphoribosyltransferase
MSQIMEEDNATKPKELSPDTFKPLLAKLIASPQAFSRSDMVDAMEHLMRPSGTVPCQIGSFFTALHLTRRESDGEILAAAIEVLRRHAVPVSRGKQNGRILDIVGTGGDGHHTFNVSTTAGVVAAGAGAQVCKVR